MLKTAEITYSGVFRYEEHDSEVGFRFGIKINKFEYISFKFIHVKYIIPKMMFSAL